MFLSLAYLCHSVHCLSCPVSLAISFSVSISVCLSVPPPCLSLSLPFFCLPVCLCLSVPISESLGLCFCLCLHVSPCPSLCLCSSSLTPSVFASLCVFLLWSSPQPVALWPELGLSWLLLPPLGHLPALLPAPGQAAVSIHIPCLLSSSQPEEREVVRTLGRNPSSSLWP